MDKREIHMRFRDVASVSLLVAALEKSNPHFLADGDAQVVEDGGKDGRERVLHVLREISTSFPHSAVDAKEQ